MFLDVTAGSWTVRLLSMELSWSCFKVVWDGGVKNFEFDIFFFLAWFAFVFT